MTKQQKGEVLADIYDLIRLNHLPKKQADDWAILTHKIGSEASKRLKSFTLKKYMLLDLDNNKIAIGKNIIISIN